MIKMEIKGLLMDPVSNMPVVILRDAENGLFLPIWVGIFEANAIALEMEKVATPRPMTHDLLKNLLTELGTRVDRVVINELKENTFFARIHLTRGDSTLSVDSRPSDAIALALRFHGPILVSEELFAKAAAAHATPAAVHLWGLTVQDLTPDMARFFEADDVQGVLVSDVEHAGAAKALARGDIITALDDAPVTSVGDLTTRAEARPHADPVRLSVRRAGQALAVHFSAD